MFKVDCLAIAADRPGSPTRKVKSISACTKVESFNPPPTIA
jgi:hypothetical protein